MKTKKKLIKDKLFLECLLVSSLAVIIFLVIVIGSGIVALDKSEKQLETLKNQTAVNISNAYQQGKLEGALYTYQTGKVAWAEQTIRGIEIVEYPIEDICNNLNSKGGK